VTFLISEMRNEEQIKFMELQLLRLYYFIFPSLIKRYVSQHIWSCNFACCFVFVWNLVLTLREWVFKSKLLRRIFWPKKEEVRGLWRKDDEWGAKKFALFTRHFWGTKQTGLAATLHMYYSGSTLFETCPVAACPDWDYFWFPPVPLGRWRAVPRWGHESSLPTIFQFVIHKIS
jgi:hypothetical protein